jgi:hypothetical protein
MRHLAAAALLASLTACSAAPDRLGVGYSRGGMDFGGTPDAWGGFSSDLEAYSVWVEWDLHKPVALEVRALRNDMRVRQHEATVEEEEERDRADLIAEAAEAAREDGPEAGSWDWLNDYVEVWALILAGVVGLLGVLWRVGVWVGAREAKEAAGK